MIGPQYIALLTIHSISYIIDNYNVNQIELADSSLVRLCHVTYLNEGQIGQCVQNNAGKRLPYLHYFTAHKNVNKALSQFSIGTKQRSVSQPFTKKLHRHNSEILNYRISSYSFPLEQFPRLVRKLFIFSLHKRKLNEETI